MTGLALRALCLPVLGAAVLSAAPPAGAAKAAAAGPAFPFPSGKISYKITHPMGSGTSDLSWMESGKRFRQDTNLKVGQGQQQQSITTWIIGDGKSLYQHQPMMGKKVLQRPLPKGGMMLGPGGLPMIAGGKQSGKVVGKATLLGKPCEIREVGNTKLWLWKGLPLKLMVGAGQQSSALGGTQVVATRVQTPAAIPAARFKVPAGYTVQKAEALTPQSIRKSLPRDLPPPPPPR